MLILLSIILLLFVPITWFGYATIGIISLFGFGVIITSLQKFHTQLSAIGIIGIYRQWYNEPDGLFWIGNLFFLGVFSFIVFILWATCQKAPPQS